MKNKLPFMLTVFVAPFAVSAAIEFLPFWLSCPISVLGAMLWVGSLSLLSKE